MHLITVQAQGLDTVPSIPRFQPNPANRGAYFTQALRIDIEIADALLTRVSIPEDGDQAAWMEYITMLTQYAHRGQNDAYRQSRAAKRYFVQTNTRLIREHLVTNEDLLSKDELVNWARRIQGTQAREHGQQQCGMAQYSNEGSQSHSDPDDNDAGSQEGQFQPGDDGRGAEQASHSGRPLPWKYEADPARFHGLTIAQSQQPDQSQGGSECTPERQRKTGGAGTQNTSSLLIPEHQDQCSSAETMDHSYAQQCAATQQNRGSTRPQKMMDIFLMLQQMPQPEVIPMHTPEQAMRHMNHLERAQFQAAPRAAQDLLVQLTNTALELRWANPEIRLPLLVPLFRDILDQAYENMGEARMDQT
jgi:hypothetical protein